MTLTNAWLLIPLALVAAALVAAVTRSGRRRGPDAPVPVAHAGRLTRLPAFRAALRRLRRSTIVIMVLLAIVVVSAAVAAARPAQTRVDDRAMDNRDVVLCLDVSGSMTDVDIDVLARFTELSKGFQGERLALVIFNSSAAQVFPLTDDYAYIQEQLESVRASLDGTADTSDAFAGTLTGAGASLIGDGLASCVLTFDNAGVERSRSVVLATDNDINGAPIMSLAEAGAFATSKGVRVYGIDPNAGSSSAGGSAESAEFEKVVESTQGEYFELESSDAVASIVDSIEKTESALVDGQPRLLVSDEPTVPVIVALLALVAALVLLRRARL